MRSNVMLLLATAFNYGAYSDESPVRAPKVSSNHFVAAYFFGAIQSHNANHSRIKSRISLSILFIAM